MALVSRPRPAELCKTPGSLGPWGRGDNLVIGSAKGRAPASSERVEMTTAVPEVDEVREWSLSSIQPLISAVADSAPPRRYTSVDKLGEGGMGVVFRASDRDLTRQVALKVLQPALAGDSEAVANFLREAETVGKLEHPCIPPVHEVGESEDGSPFIVMRLVRGQTLSEIIAQLAAGDAEAHNRFSFGMRARMMLQLCDAVQFAFENGVVHRDIKPENVMVGPFGELQLMDWGCSFDKQRSVPLEDGFVGTPGYAAPERFSDAGAALLLTSEVWSLGLVMYELFALKPAFAPAPVAKVIQAVMMGRMAAAETVRAPVQSSCPREYAAIIGRATRLDPSDRYTAASEMRDAIQQALEDEAPVICPATAFKRSAGILDRLVDNGGGLVAFGIAVWALLPILLTAWILAIRYSV